MPKAVSQNEVVLFQAKLSRLRPRWISRRPNRTSPTSVAPFDGIVDRLHEQLGSLVKEGDILTTLVG